MKRILYTLIALSPLLVKSQSILTEAQINSMTNSRQWPLPPYSNNIVYTFLHSPNLVATGTLTAGYIPYAISSRTLTNSPFYTNGTNVSIGTLSLTSTFNVVGSLMYIDGNQGTGKLLRSDANGIASWITYTITAVSQNTVTIAGSGISVSTGSYPNFTITSTEAQTLSISSNTITISGTGSYVTLPSSSSTGTWTGTVAIGSLPYAYGTTTLTGSPITTNGTNSFINAGGLFVGGSGVSTGTVSILDVQNTFTGAAPSSLTTSGINVFVESKRNSGGIDGLYGVLINAISSPTGTATPAIIGLNTLATLNSPNNSITGNFQGARIGVATTAVQTGTIVDAASLAISIPDFQGSKPNLFDGIKIPNEGVSGINKSYGVRILAQSGSTNNYGIVSGGAAFNGFGTFTATATMDVRGTMRLVDGNQGIGKILADDGTGTGVITWSTFSVTSASSQTVTIGAGTGITIQGSYPTFTVVNSLPDQTVAFTSVGTNTFTGTYPNFTLTTPTDNSAFTNGVGYITTSLTALGINMGTVTPSPFKLQVVETSTATPRGVAFDQYDNGINSSKIFIRKARGTRATPTTILVSDLISNFTSSAYDGTSFVDAASIRATSTYSVSTGITPASLMFMTMNRSGTLTTGLTIDEAQNGIFTGSLTATNLSNTNTGDIVASISTNTLSFTGQTTSYALSLNTLTSEPNLATVGTVTSGTWNGTAIAAANGGTGIITYSVGDLITATGATTLSRLPDVAVGSFLRSTGLNTAPVWSTLTFTNSVASSNLLYATGTNLIGSTTDMQYDGTNLNLGSTVTTAGVVGFNSSSTNNAASSFYCSRSRADGTQPGAGMAARLNFNLEGSVNNTMVTASSINAAWETAQSNATTQRNSDIEFHTILANSLNEAWRISSNGYFSNTGASGTSYIDLKAGTSSIAPLGITSGTLLTAPVDGKIERDRTWLYYTNTDLVRQEIQQVQNRRASVTYSANATATLATVSTLTVNVAAGQVYSFEANLFIAADGTGGSKYAIDGSATATNVIYEVFMIDNTTNTNTITSRQTALGGSVGQAGTTSGFCRIRGTITVNGAGSLGVNFSQNTGLGTSTIILGSTFSVNLIQ